jgi:hypothetical protein
MPRSKPNFHGFREARGKFSDSSSQLTLLVNVLITIRVGVFFSVLNLVDIRQVVWTMLSAHRYDDKDKLFRIVSKTRINLGEMNAYVKNRSSVLTL